MDKEQRSKSYKSDDSTKKKIKHIFNLVIQETGLDIFRQTRRREYVDARTFAAKLLRSELGITTIHIGKLLNKNHATIIHGLKLFDDLYETDYDFKSTYKKIYEKFKLEDTAPVTDEVDDKIKKLQTLYDNKIKVLNLENSQLKSLKYQNESHPYNDIREMIYSRLDPKYKKEFKKVVNTMLNGIYGK